MLARTQFGQSEAAQGFRVHENVGRVLAACEEAEAAQAIEPFHPRALEPAGRRHRYAGTRRRQLRRMYRSRRVHGEDSKRLQAALASQRLDHDARAFAGDLEAVTPQAPRVQQNVGLPVVGHDEAIAFGDVEPLDDAGKFDDVRGRIADSDTTGAFDPGTTAPLLQCNRVSSHDTPPSFVAPVAGTF